MIFQPHPYQAYCIERLLTDPALGLYLDMGLGKTVITLTAIADLEYNRFQVSRALVIAPKRWRKPPGRGRLPNGIISGTCGFPPYWGVRPNESGR